VEMCIVVLICAWPGVTIAVLGDAPNAAMMDGAPQRKSW